jgi:catechol 2,3-dioxygenase-like lactoylglutathione lyase family enzyme
MDWTLEVVVVPVSDVDRSTDFYSARLGFNVDHDTMVGPQHRVVQLSPPGSGCSVVIMSGMQAHMEPGTLRGVQLCVSDLRAAREQLLERGVEVSEIQIFDQGETRDYRDGDSLDISGFVFFDDPDGNGWAVQQMPGRN